MGHWFKLEPEVGVGFGVIGSFSWVGISVGTAVSTSGSSEWVGGGVGSDVILVWHPIKNNKKMISPLFIVV